MFKGLGSGLGLEVGLGLGLRLGLADQALGLRLGFADQVLGLRLGFADQALVHWKSAEGVRPSSRSAPSVAPPPACSMSIRVRVSPRPHSCPDPK